MSEKLMEQQNLSSNQNKLSEKWIDAIFEEFHGRFGNNFLSKFMTGTRDRSGKDAGVENAKNVWAKRLADFLPEEIARGVNTEYKYPPDLDTFKRACRPELDYEAAFHEAIQQMHLRAEGKDEWSNPAIFHAAARIGHDMGNGYDFIKTRWKTELDKAIYDVSAGHLSKVIAKREKPTGLLSAPKRDGKYSEAAIQALAEIDTILNTEPAWRKSLREKGKDTSTPKAGLRPMSDYINLKEEETA